jgi:hypothetical protein
MKLSHILAPFLATTAFAVPSRSHGKPAYFVLAGDSTTAPGGGWGDGFLSTAVREPAGGINLGHSGATTVSFRNGGDWTTVIEEVRNHTASHEVFVTIQVSHTLHPNSSMISCQCYMCTERKSNPPSLATTTKNPKRTSPSLPSPPTYATSLKKSAQPTANPFS